MHRLPKAKTTEKITTSDKKLAKELVAEGFTKKEIEKDIYLLSKKLEKWDIFEKDMGLLLEYMDFKDVTSGPSSRLGTNQIDAKGGFGKTLLIIECKSAEKSKEKSLTSIINNFAGKKSAIEKSVLENYDKKYDEIKLIIALEDIEPTKENLELASEKGIDIWGDTHVDAIKGFFKIAGPLTKYYILKELGVSSKLIEDEDKDDPFYKIPSFRVEIGDETDDEESEKDYIYYFLISVEKLINLTYVFRLKPGSEGAYQRFVKEYRVKDIAEFINDGGIFKNNIVCSFEESVKFKAISPGGISMPQGSEFGILEIPKFYCSIWIIDGQHRIYGYVNADSSLQTQKIAVIASASQSEMDQAKDYIDINHKQKSVSSSELWELLALTDPSSPMGTITRLAKSLNSKKGGLFKNKIFIQGEALRNKSSYSLTLASVCNGLRDRRLLKLKTEIKKGGDGYTDDLIDYFYTAINDFYRSVKKTAEDTKEKKWIDEFIFTNNGFNVLLRVFTEVIKYQEGKWNKAKMKELVSDAFAQYFKENIDKIDSIRKGTSPESRRGEEALQIIRLINNSHEDFAKDYIKKEEERLKDKFLKSDSYNTIKDIELGLRMLIVEKLSDKDKEWWKRLIPGDVSSSADERLQKKDSPFPHLETIKKKDPIHYLNFADYSKILICKTNWESSFMSVYTDKEQLKSKLKELEIIRNVVQHFKRDLDPDEKLLLQVNSRFILKPLKTPKK